MLWAYLAGLFTLPVIGLIAMGRYWLIDRIQMHRARRFIDK